MNITKNTYNITIYPENMYKFKKNYLKFENITEEKCAWYVSRAELKNDKYIITINNNN